MYLRDSPQLEVQFGDTHVVHRMMLVTGCGVDMRGGSVVGWIVRKHNRLTVHGARRLHRSLDAGLEPRWC